MATLETLRDREGDRRPAGAVAAGPAGDLAQAARLEVLGQLASGIVHDFNNLITAINGYSELVLARLDPADPRRADVIEIRRAGERAAGLTRHLLAFSRNQLPRTERVDLGRLVREARPLLRRLLPENIAVVTDLAPDLGVVEANPVQLEEVLLNLAVNARDAMPGGGELLLAAANATLDAAYSGRRPVVLPGDYVLLQVSDTGHGIPAADQERIFDAYFTSKPQGEGTGIGLATVYGIVKQHQGYVWVYSEVDQGATFKVYLPRRREEAVRGERPRPAVRAPGGREAVLLVEDDDMVRAVTAEILGGLGYRVHAAARGEEALALCRSLDREVALALTDVVMPGLPVTDLVRELRGSWPEVRLLFMSGYPRRRLVRRGILAPDAPFLEKPFSADLLARKVRSVLGREAAPAEGEQA